MALFSATSTVLPRNLAFVSSSKLFFLCSSSPRFLPIPQSNNSHNLTIHTTRPRALTPRASASPSASFHGLCYVVGDNIDTDQIIPAEHLTLVPSNPDEYEKLGSSVSPPLTPSSSPAPTSAAAPPANTLPSRSAHPAPPQLWPNPTRGSSLSHHQCYHCNEGLLK